MRIAKPGGPYHDVFFTTNPSTGEPRDATTGPTAEAVRNGSIDAGFVLVVSNLAVGEYSISGTVPVGYAPGDIVSITVFAGVDDDEDPVVTHQGSDAIDKFTVVPVSVYDSLIVGTDNLGVDMLEVAGTGVSGPDDLKADLVDISQLEADVAFLFKAMRNRKELQDVDGTYHLVIYDDDDTSIIMDKIIKDPFGNDISALFAGVLAREIKSTV